MSHRCDSHRAERTDGPMGGVLLSAVLHEKCGRSGSPNGVECLPIMHELDNEPSMCKLEAAMAEMTTGKAPGMDGIPPEVLKCLKGPSLMYLYDILIYCWRAGTVP